MGYNWDTEGLLALFTNSCDLLNNKNVHVLIPRTLNMSPSQAKV